MAISRVPGYSLLANLDRQGTDVYISSNGQTLFYWDVNNYRIGINQSTPQETLDVNGNSNTVTVNQSSLIADSNVNLKTTGSNNTINITSMTR